LVPVELVHFHEYVEVYKDINFNLNEQVILKDTKNYGKSAKIINDDHTNQFIKVEISDTNSISNDIGNKICSKRIHEINQNDWMSVKDAGEKMKSHGTILNRITGSVRLDLIIKEYDVKINIDIGLQLKDHRKANQTVCNE
jgi:hypothetical protein